MIYENSFFVMGIQHLQKISRRIVVFSFTVSELVKVLVLPGMYASRIVTVSLRCTLFGVRLDCFVNQSPTI